MISLTPCPSVEDHRQSRVNRPERTSIGDYWVPRPGDPRQPLRYAGRSLRSARPCDEHAVCPDLQAVRAVLLLAVKVVEGLPSKITVAYATVPSERARTTRGASFQCEAPQTCSAR
jgi:hypothetical protein